jgi:cell volume regulation protein A
VPGPRTVLRRGDQLLIVASSAVRDRTEERLHAVSQGGRLAVWAAPPSQAEPPGRLERLRARLTNR